MANQHKTQPAICQYEKCGKIFQAAVAEVRRGGGRFCSGTCRNRARAYSPQTAPIKSQTAPVRTKLTQRERIFAVLEARGYVSNGHFAAMGLTHIGRNRITDKSAKAYWAARGYIIVFEKGQLFLDNKWVLKLAAAVEAETYPAGRRCLDAPVHLRREAV